MTQELRTEDKLEYQFYPVTAGSLFFKVKCANDAHIALAPSPTEGTPMYEIMIGGWNNGKTAIRKNRTKPDKAFVDTPGICNAGEYRGFWIRWGNGNIAVGKEAEAEPFATYDDPEPFAIAYYGICTGWGATGDWIIEDADSCKELQTPDKLTYAWHIVEQGCVEVEVSCPHNAHVALTTGPGETDLMYEILLGGWENSASVIRSRREKPDKVRVNTPSLLASGEYRRFLICWKKGRIYVVDGTGRNLLEWTDPQPFGISHFGVRTAWGSTGQWRVRSLARPPFSVGASAPPPPPAHTAPTAPQVPPAANAPGWAVDPSFAGGAATWVDASGGTVPPGAVPAGVDNEQLYVGRAQHEGAYLPGKVVPSHGVCYVPWGGGEHGKSEYQVLCGCNPVWMPTSGGRIPADALPAGESEDGEPLFIGRAMHNGAATVGKVQASHNCCYVPYGGQELPFSEYEVLVAK